MEDGPVTEVEVAAELASRSVERARLVDDVVDMGDGSLVVIASRPGVDRPKQFFVVTVQEGTVGVGA